MDQVMSEQALLTLISGYDELVNAFKTFTSSLQTINEKLSFPFLDDNTNSVFKDFITNKKKYLSDLQSYNKQFADALECKVVKPLMSNLNLMKKIVNDSQTLSENKTAKLYEVQAESNQRAIYYMIKYSVMLLKLQAQSLYVFYQKYEGYKKSDFMSSQSPIGSLVDPNDKIAQIFLKNADKNWLRSAACQPSSSSNADASLATIPVYKSCIPQKTIGTGLDF